MYQRILHADTPAGYAALTVGAFVGPLGLLLLTAPGSMAALAALVLLLGFGLSYAVAVSRVSPRLASVALAAVALGAFLRLLDRIGEIGTIPLHVGTLVLWLALGVWAATQWFDHRRTYGMAGVGLGAATVGGVGYFIDEVAGWFVMDAFYTASWPGGEAVGEWLVVPWRLAFVVALLWTAMSGAWLMTVHSKEHAALRAAGTAT